MFALQIDTGRTWRGRQHQTLLTTMGLRELGHRVVLVAHPDGELRRRAEEGGEVLPLAPKSDVDLTMGWQLSRVIGALGPDVVHAHDPYGVAATALALSLGRPPRRPAFVASRRLEFHLRGNSFSRWTRGQVDRFIAASESVRRMLVEDGVDEARTVTVHQGVDVDRVARTEPLNIRAALWLPHDAPVVCNVAALVPHKGHRYLIDAAALVVRDVPDARFVILGEGELRPALEHQVKELHLERHVFLPGFRADVLALLKTVDLFAMSSVTEGLATSLLDAMAAETAIVATDAGGIPEVVVAGETGLLVPPRNPQAMAVALVRLLRDEHERARMARAGLARVRERFSVQRMIRDTLAVYERTLAEKHLPSAP